MKLKMRGNRIGVVRPKKGSGGDSVIYIPDDNNASGLVKYVGPDVEDGDLKIGVKVYFGSRREEVKIAGEPILVMDEDNVYAIAEDHGDEQKKESTTE